MSLTIYIPAHLSRELWMMDRNKSITQLYKSIQKKLGCGPLNITLSAHWEKITPEFHQHLDLGAIKEDSGLYSILELSISQVGKAVSQDRHYARKKKHHSWELPSATQYIVVCPILCMPLLSGPAEAFKCSSQSAPLQLFSWKEAKIWLWAIPLDLVMGTSGRYDIIGQRPSCCLLYFLSRSQEHRTPDCAPLLPACYPTQS